MYDEFIKRLREKAEAFDYDGWVETASDYEKAAKVIEELIPFKKQVEKGMGLLDKADELLKAVKLHWIPVTERLPETYTSVLLYSGEEVYTGYMHSDKQFTANASHFHGRPTHWMPLPEPPKEE